MQGKKVFIAKKARAKKPKKGEKPAAGEQSGERLSKLGKIHMAVFTPDGRSMVGYLVARPDVAGMVKREDVFVAFDSLAACEKGFRVVGEEGAFDDKARERLGVDWDSCIMWAGMDARTESGRELGYVGDAEFDESTGKVTKFLVGDGGMATALVGSVEIPPSMMVGYSKGRMIVKDEASKLELNGGLAAKAGEATAKAKIRGAELARRPGRPRARRSTRARSHWARHWARQSAPSTTPALKARRSVPARRPRSCVPRTRRTSFPPPRPLTCASPNQRPRSRLAPRSARLRPSGPRPMP